MSLVSKELSRRLLLKHTATVHSSSRLTMIQKKIFNLFIYKAFPTIHDDKYHTFTVGDLLQSLNWSVDSHINDRLKEALAGLTRENVKWNVLEKDKKNKWVSSSCLADVSIKNGVIEYSFGKFLREVLHNPNIYAKIDLDVQSNLESKDSLIIWEVAMEELSSKKTMATITHWIDWEKMCSITSGEGTSYAKTYSLYKSKVLNKAIAEINAKTDLKVTMLEQKEGRKVKRIAFQVIRFDKANENISQGTEKCLGQWDRDITLKEQIDQIIGNPEKSKELWLKYSDETLLGAINFYKETLSNPENAVKNPVAFFRKAVEEGWYPMAEALSKIDNQSSKPDANESYIDFHKMGESESASHIRKQLYEQYGAVVYNAWFYEATFDLQSDRCVILHPHPYAHTYIMQKLYDQLLTVIQKNSPNIIWIEIQHEQPQLL